MNTKNTWVKCVGALVVIVALMGMPVAAQAAPVQGGGDENSTQWMSVDWYSGLSQIWDSLKVALGMQSEPETPRTPIVSPPNPQSRETLTQERTLDEHAEASPAIDPIG